ncbi:hypothetical protein IMX07_01895 [bacterium]|nr:hypothetical protein [bacterium]
MNCFEARKEFVSFWRRTLNPARRADFSQHLEHCDRCDRSFRLFALSAPVFHSDREPEVAPRSYSTPPRPRIAVARRPMRRVPAAPAPWRAMAAAVALLMVGGASVWSVQRIPSRNFPDTFAADDLRAAPTAYFPDGAAIENPAEEPALFESIAPDLGQPNEG